MNNTNLDIDVDLRAWKQLGHYSSFKGLFQMKAHLSRLAVPVRSPLPLCCTEGGHTVLTVDNSPIMPSPAARASHLGGDTIPCVTYKANVYVVLNYRINVK